MKTTVRRKSSKEPAAFPFLAEDIRDGQILYVLKAGVVGAYTVLGLTPPDSQRNIRGMYSKGNTFDIYTQNTKVFQGEITLANV